MFVLAVCKQRRQETPLVCTDHTVSAPYIDVQSHEEGTGYTGLWTSKNGSREYHSSGHQVLMVLSVPLISWTH